MKGYAAVPISHAGPRKIHWVIGEVTYCGIDVSSPENWIQIGPFREIVQCDRCRKKMKNLDVVNGGFSYEAKSVK